MMISLGYREGFAWAARRRGIDMHFVVEKDYAQLRDVPHTRVSQLADSEEVLRAVLAAELPRPTGVVTGAEQALLSAAVLRIALDLPGDRDLAAVPRFRDKYLQKSALPPSVPHAGCEYLPRHDASYSALAERLGERIVLKPANGYGGLATVVVSNQVELDRYLADHPVSSDVATVAEQFIEGEEIHVDGIWFDGHPGWMAVSKYPAPLLVWHVGGVVGDTVLGSAQPELQRRAKALAVDAPTALGTPDCVFHLEAFVSEADGSIVFGEVAARLVGAKCPQLLNLTYGVDLHEVAIDVAVGAPPQILPVEDPPEVFGFVFLNRDPGCELTETDFRDAFDLVECDYPGADAGRVRSYGRWGHAITSAPDHAQLERLIDDIATFNRSGQRATP